MRALHNVFARRASFAAIGLLLLTTACGADGMQSVDKGQTEALQAGLTDNPNSAPLPAWACEVDVSMGTQWDASGMHHGLVTATVRNTTGWSVSVPWSLTLVHGRYVDLLNPWHWSAAIDRGDLLGQATQTWELLKPYGANSVQVGGELVAFTNAIAPTSAYLNGQPCSMILQAE